MTRRLIAWAALFALAGCSSNAVREVPAPLVDFTPTVAVKELWSENVGAGVKGWLGITPKVEGNTIYAADPAGNVSAYDIASGRRRWSVDLDIRLSGGVGAGDDLVLVGTREGRVYALDQATGKTVWDVSVSSEVLAPPAASGGVTVVQTIDGKLFGLSSTDGKRLWLDTHNEPALSLRGTDAPVISGDMVVAGFANGKLAALSLREGRLLWEATVAEPRGRNEIERLVDVDASPLVLPDAIYAASFQGKLVAINPRSGALGWSRDTSTYTGLATDGSSIYVTDEDGRVLAFDRRSGATLWRQEALHGRHLNAPVVYRGFVVVADYEGYLHWLARDDGHFVARYRVGGDPIRAPAVVDADTLFVLGGSGTLAALQASEK